jgi:hypothetical protein
MGAGTGTDLSGSPQGLVALRPKILLALPPADRWV